MGEKLTAKKMFEKKDQSTALIIGVSIFCLFVVFSIFAWTGPPGTPPDPNAPAPINVSSSGQEKEGQFGIAIPSGQFLDGSYGLTVGTASNPLGIKTSGDSFFESAFTSFKGIALDDAASGKNLIPNWQMESDTYWTDNLEQTSVADFNGVNHYAHRSDETDTGCYNWAHTALIPADANKLYKFSIWIKSDDSTMNNYFGFHIYDSNKTRITGDWSNPYFKTSEGDANSWRKWTAYLGPSYSDIATGCDSGKTNGNDWCMAADTAYIKMRFGACYGDGGSNGYSWFMYPKIEEVDPDDSYFVGNTVFMDGNVGIGTVSPGHKLQVAVGVTEDHYQLRLGTTANYYDIGRNYTDGLLYFTGNQVDPYKGFVFNGGNVGIGTTGSSAKLDVAGTDTTGIKYLKSGSKDARIMVGDPGKNWSMAVGWATQGDFSIIEEGIAGDRLYIKQGGNVGIGTTNPQAKLEVSLPVSTIRKYVRGLTELGLLSPQCPCDTDVVLINCPNRFETTDPEGSVCYDHYGVIFSAVYTVQDFSQPAGNFAVSNTDVEGSVFYDPNIKKLKYFDGLDWQILGEGGGFGATDCYWNYGSRQDVNLQECNDGYYLKGIDLDVSGTWNRYRIRCCRP